MSNDLAHLDEHGKAVMVDVTGKAVTHRRAVSRALVRGVRAQTLFGPDAEVLTAARMAGLAAAKQTSSLVPLCHPLPLTGIAVDFASCPEGIEVMATAETAAQTGVEMEALAACAVAALSIVASLGGSREEASIEALAVWEKSGGRSGTWRRDGHGIVVEERA